MIPAVDNTGVDIDAAAYDATVWHELYVMVGGAAAALAGLLFVAVSINLDRVIAGQGLPRRAAETLVIMVSLLTVSVVVLTPQHRTALGWEALAVGLFVLAILLSRFLPKTKPAGPGYRRVIPVVILGLFAVPIVVGGLSLLAGAGGGLYWFVPAVVMGFAGAVLNAWVLLVEIMR